MRVRVRVVVEWVAEKEPVGAEKVGAVRAAIEGREGRGARYVKAKQ